MLLRRVVTGVGPDGAGIFVQDGPAPHVITNDDRPGLEVSYLWSTEEPPSVPGSGAESTRLDQEPVPPVGGTRLISVTYPPGFGPREPAARPPADVDDAAAAPFDDSLLHTTETVDYGVVLRGEICIVLTGGEERALAAGDVLVHNGAAHGWRNRRDEPAVVLYVIVGGRAVER
ncbi:cupin domain-containing protein [Frankia sp. QA3]|uniref:cupin domain-containing protein n=1 Tax=Frankia sp. QA3 TaxID=710111 RepID=UPI000269BE0B|nr:cupin domain-containing protein [Frankia sp. QA3]EIV91408.1 cupin domain-containing protein [Frankia sp. QA3]